MWKCLDQTICQSETPSNISLDPSFLTKSTAHIGNTAAEPAAAAACRLVGAEAGPGGPPEAAGAGAWALGSSPQCL